MPKNYKNILSLTSEEVLDFFMKSEQFHGFELPKYFLTSLMHHLKHLMMNLLKDMKEKQDIIKIYDKLYKQHNSDYNQLWLQNMIYAQDKKRKKSPYTIRLCQLVMNESCKPLWNNEWLKPDFSKNLPYKSIVNKNTLNKVTPVIVFRETRLYNEHIY